MSKKGFCMAILFFILCEPAIYIVTYAQSEILFWFLTGFLTGVAFLIYFKNGEKGDDDTVGNTDNDFINTNTCTTQDSTVAGCTQSTCTRLDTTTGSPNKISEKKYVNYTAVNLNCDLPQLFEVTPEQRKLYENFTERFIFKHILYEDYEQLGNVKTTLPSSDEVRQNRRILQEIFDSKYKNLTQHHSYMLTPKITWMITPVSEMRTIDNGLTWMPLNTVDCFQLERIDFTTTVSPCYAVYHVPRAQVVFQSIHHQEIDHFKQCEPTDSEVTQVAIVFFRERV